MKFWNTQLWIKWKESTIVPGLILLLLVAYAHSQMSWDGDASWFRKMDLSVSWAVTRYLYWSSRILLDALCVAFLTIFGITAWHVADACVMWLCCRLLVELACPRDRQAFGMWCMIPIVLLFPLGILHTAGWPATLFNYLWPGTALLAALIPVKWIWEGRHVPSWLAVSSLFPLALALNSEQSWLLFSGIWLFAVWFQFRQWPRKLLFAQGIMIVAAAAFIAFCPGNERRIIGSIYGCWPDFGTTSLLDKIVLGINNMGSFFLTQELFLLLFTAVLAWKVWRKYDDLFFHMIGILPLALKWGTVAYLAYRAWDRLRAAHAWTMDALLGTIALSPQHIVTPLSADRFSAYLPLAASLLFFVSIALALYVLYGHTKTSFCMVGLYLLGCGSSLLPALSPTLFASSTRIFFFQYLVDILILLQMMCMQRQMSSEEDFEEGKG